ncbi:MAG: RidA family protein [Anaerolineae bacterium]
MEREDFWHNRDAQEAGTIPTGSKAGQFLFLSAQTPANLDTGAVAHSLWELPPEGRDQTVTGQELLDARQGRIKAQTWTIYNNLSRILAQQGSSLQNIVRQRIFLLDVQDTSAMEEVMLRFFPGEKPATTIHGVGKDGVQEGLRIQVEVIAFIPQAGELRREAVIVPALAPVTAPYPAAVKVGQFLFTSGIIGMDPGTGRVISRLADLGEDAKEVATQRTHTDATLEAGKAQWWLIYRHIQRIMESQGGSVTNLLRSNFYNRYTFLQEAEVHPLRQLFFKSRENMPTTSGFAINGLHPRDEVRLLADVVALLPGEYRKEVGFHLERRVTYGIMWAKGGPLWLCSGDLALDAATHRIIRSFSDLGEDAHWLAQGRLHDAQTTMAQAWYIYQSLDHMMKSARSGLPRVAQQSIYLRNASHYPAVESIARIVYGSRIPPTTVVPVDGIGPYDDLMLEIETISLAD